MCHMSTKTLGIERKKKSKNSYKSLSVMEREIYEYESKHSRNGKWQK